MAERVSLCHRPGTSGRMACWSARELVRMNTANRFQRKIWWGIHANADWCHLFFRLFGWMTTNIDHASLSIDRGFEQEKAKKSRNNSFDHYIVPLEMHEQIHASFKALARELDADMKSHQSEYLSEEEEEQICRSVSQLSNLISLGMVLNNC